MRQAYQLGYTSPLTLPLHTPTLPSADRARCRWWPFDSRKMPLHVVTCLARLTDGTASQPGGQVASPVCQLHPQTPGRVPCAPLRPPPTRPSCEHQVDGGTVWPSVVSFPPAIKSPRRPDIHVGTVAWCCCRPDRSPPCASLSSRLPSCVN